MRECLQFPSMNMLEHGLDIHKRFLDLYGHLKGSETKMKWKLPEWIYDPKILPNLLDLEILRYYQTYHDCGKPFCLTLDDCGKRHFPNHAQVSERTWLKYSDGLAEARLIGSLISKDMDIHILKDEESIKTFAQSPLATSLLLTGLCEIHSNCQSFGGLDSTSFKIKWKQLNRIGKKILVSIPE